MSITPLVWHQWFELIWTVWPVELSCKQNLCYQKALGEGTTGYINIHLWQTQRQSIRNTIKQTHLSDTSMEPVVLSLDTCLKISETAHNNRTKDCFCSVWKDRTPTYRKYVGKHTETLFKCHQDNDILSNQHIWCNSLVYYPYILTGYDVVETHRLNVNFKSVGDWVWCWSTQCGP